MTDAAQIEVLDTQARQCVWSGKGNQLVENRSETITVYLGSDEGMDPSGSDVSLVDPLGQKTFDGSQDWWCRLADGTAGPVEVISTPSAIASVPSPALMAAQIQAALQPNVQQANSGLAGPGATAILVPGAPILVWAVVLSYSLAGTPTSGGAVTWDISDTLSVLYFPAVVRVNSGLVTQVSDTVVLQLATPALIPAGDDISITISAGLGATPDGIGAIMYSAAG